MRSGRTSTWPPSTSWPRMPLTTSAPVGGQGGSPVPLFLHCDLNLIRCIFLGCTGAVDHLAEGAFDDQGAPVGGGVLGGSWGAPLVPSACLNCTSPLHHKGTFSNMDPVDISPGKGSHRTMPHVLS